MEVATNGLKQPPGFRFLPTLEQAIECYLKPKILGYIDDRVPDGMIPEVDMLAFEPWELAAVLRERWIMLTANDQDEEWWFFYQQRDARKGCVQRLTHSGSGYWNKTGDDLMITAGDSNRVIGSKKNAVFYRGRRPNGIKTNWVTHEHHATRLDDFFPMRKNLVLCSIKQNRDRKANITETKEQRDSVLEQNTEAVTSSRIMPPVEQESQVQITSFYPQQLLLCSLPSENISLDSEQLQQLHSPRSENFLLDDEWVQLDEPSFSSENSTWSNLQSSIGISLEDDFIVTDESNQLEFFVSNSEDDEDNVSLIHQQVDRESMLADGEDDEAEEFINTVLIDCDEFGGDQMPMECGQTYSLHNEQAVLMESRRTQTTNTIHGIIPLDEEKGIVQRKVNDGGTSSAKPMAPQKKPANDARVAGRDAQNVFKHKLAAPQTELERASLDEPSAEAQVVEINKQSGTTISSQKKSMNKIGQDGVEPKSKKKSTCKDTEISPFYSLVYLRNAGIGIVLLIAFALRVLYF